MNIQPKHTASRAFSCAGRRYEAGDPVEHPVVLAAVLQFGDKFVTTAAVKRRGAKAAPTSEGESPEDQPTTPESPSAPEVTK